MAALAGVIVIARGYRFDYSKARIRALGLGALGLVVGLALFVMAFLALEVNNPPSSFMRAAFEPSRSAWSIGSDQIDAPIERLWLTVSGTQWRGVMFPGVSQFARASGTLLWHLIWLEYSPIVVVLAVLGVVALARGGQARKSAGRMLLAQSAFVPFMALNYQPGDQYVFFIPVFVLTAALAGVGASVGAALIRDRHSLVGALASLVLFTAIGGRFATGRIDALSRGVATMFGSDYVYDIKQPRAARRYAEARLRGLPQNALALVDWRGMYALFYVAHVDGARPDAAFYEALPYGTNGALAASMIERLKRELADGRVVVAEQRYNGLERNFFVRKLAGTDWYAVSARP
jgi:hypothetical protein